MLNMSFFQSSLYSVLNREEAFKLFMNELKISLLKQEILIDFKKDGLFKNKEKVIGKIKSILPGTELTIEWNEILENIKTRIVFTCTFEPHNSGTLILFKTINLIPNIQNDERELIGWYVDNIIVHVLKNLEKNSFDDWLTDRTVRKPTGPNAKIIYSDPLFHLPNFYFILDFLKLQPSDVVLEVGCGGGVLVREMATSGCKITAIDHSPEMVQLAKENNIESIENGKVEIVQAVAEKIPFNNDQFTHIVSTGVFQFVKQPEVVLREIYRVLKPQGQLIIYGGSKEMKGTPAAPEPFASRLKFYDKKELEDLAKDIGFYEIQVIQPDLTEYAKKVGIPNKQLAMFDKKFSLVLLAKKMN